MMPHPPVMPPFDAELVEAIAQAIHDTDDMADTVWPDGEDDNGYRGDGGHVRLCPNPEAYRLAAVNVLRLVRQHDATAAQARTQGASDAGTVEALREALRPFVEFTKAGSFDRLPDGMPMTQGSSLAFRQVTAGDFKRARDVYAATDGRS